MEEVEYNNNLTKAKENMVLKEKFLSSYACKSKDGIWLEKDYEDIRPIFYRDIDRIIHSSGYTRYIDKTQVYSFVKNDHVSTRGIHVQLVAKIARTIGRSLCLNEDLIEAISLAHDIGHAPFGHKGEDALNEICKKEKIGYFYHNAESVRILRDIENLNISLQTLDGILSHNGEILKNKYEYNPSKTRGDFERDLTYTFNVEDYSKEIIPMTLEASVVRLSDVIAYIGRDIEDSIEIGLINREDLPKNVKEILGDTNRKIVDTLIKDIIVNSLGKNYLQFSKKIFDALIILKDWNYKNIYNSKVTRKNYEKLDVLFEQLYNFYLRKIEGDDSKYLSKTQSGQTLYSFTNKLKQRQGEDNIKRIIIDYIAGQTDQFFLNECRINLGDLGFKV